MEKFKVAIIEWEDASHYSNSENIEWLKKEASPLQVSTAGFIIKSGRKEIIIAHEIGEKERARNTSIICRRDIKKIIYLKEEEGMAKGDRIHYQLKACPSEKRNE